MAEIVKDLGVATAYGYAKANGYTGTEEEFGVLMASYATVADEAAASAAAASASADDSSDSAAEAAQKVLDAAAQVTLATEQAQAAAASATEASGYATDASGSATDAETYKTQAQGFSQDAGADAALALGYKNAAQTYAGNAETSATNAADSASAASTSATNASTSATNAANSATAAAASATSAAESAAHLVIDDELSTESENAVQNKLITSALETKAEVDGAYEQMTVGNAEQLVSNVGIEDSVPYNFRTSGGSADIGDREVDKIVGGTVAWNQKFPNRTDTYSSETADIVGNNDGSFTITIKVDGASGGVGNPTSVGANAFVAGHKFLLYSANTLIGFTLKTYQKNSNTVFIADTASYNNVAFLYSNLPIGTYTVKPMIFDLTQMFGSTIADYIYALEQSTAGAGVAWFKKLFPKPYYAYNAGELMSVQTSAHKMVGFNAWDEEWESGTININTGNTATSTTDWRSKNFIPALPNTTYHFHNGGTENQIIIYYYNANDGFIGSRWGVISTDGTEFNFTTPEGTAFIKFVLYQASTHYGMTYNHDICINLSWDGERDGEYEEYKQLVYPLDSDLVLRGIPKLSSGNDLYYDGDTYESDGTVTRRFAILTFNGTEQWLSTTAAGHTRNRCLSALTGIKQISAGNEAPNMLSNIYPVVSPNDTYSGKFGVTCQQNASDIYVFDSAFDYENSASAFMTYLSTHPLTVIYELATPTTESADPFTNPQIVDDFGTEEYVDARDVAIPVGHETFYQANLKAKLEMAPNSPDGDGDYVVRQTNGQNEYVPLLFPASDIPAAPSENGTYSLTVTVSNGTATYSWAANS